MTDRELLELAAKAAGCLDDQIYPSHDEGLVLFNKDQDQMTDGTYWNPLTDDGDALRLANKLRMRIEHHIRHPYVAVFAGVDFDKVKAEEPAGDDVNAATRRAIVRAAAEIGKAMP